jgi:prophage tail gpP-like protein
VTLPIAADANTVTLRVGDKQFTGWESVSITRSCETMPNSFTVSAAPDLLRDVTTLAGTRPGQPCTILIGSDLVITGWIDRRTIGIGPRSHEVTLIGRGITRNLVDCSADLLNDPGLKGGMIDATSTRDLAQKLCKAFGITVRSAVADLGIPIPKFQIHFGETPFEIIESVARYAGYLLYENELGQLVLDRVGTKSMASGFTMGVNVESISAERAEDVRYSDYIVVYYGINTLSEVSPLANQRAIVKDTTMPEYRPLIKASAQITPAYDVGKAMANWEWARRLGRSQAAHITCDSWRDASGALWTPNRLATIEAPAADITGKQWIISSVTFRKDLAGTHADLVLMPPMAFEPEPNPLNLWDAETLGQTPASQNSAPPDWLPGPT